MKNISKLTNHLNDARIPYLNSIENKNFSMKSKIIMHPSGSAATTSRRTDTNVEMNTSFRFVKDYVVSMEGILRFLLIVSFFFFKSKNSSRSVLLKSV